MSDCEFTIGEKQKNHICSAMKVNGYSNLSENQAEFWIWRDDIRVTVNKNHRVGKAIQKLVDKDNLTDDKMDNEILILVLKNTTKYNMGRVLALLAKHAEERGYRKARAEVARTVSQAMSFLTNGSDLCGQ